MLKNTIKIFIFFILCICNMGNSSHAFLGEEPGLDLYSIIDEGLEELDNQNFYYELSGEKDTITENVNQLIHTHYEGIGENCISGDLSPSDVIDIGGGNIQLLTKKLGDDCKNSDGKSFEIQKLQKIQSIIREHVDNTQLIAEEKTEQIQKIGSVGLYADGMLENGSFDLIEDLKNIDSIIFHEETIYEGEEYENLNNYFEEKLDEKRQLHLQNTTDPEVREELIKIDPNYTEVLEINNIQDINILESIVNEPFAFNSGNNYVCKEGIENHGFEEDILNNITGNNDSGSNEDNNGGDNSENQDVNNSDDINNNLNTGNNNTDSGVGNNIGEYIAVNDNGAWPCNNFFCITVDFVVNEQPLFGGNQDITIEYLIDRSNQHLKKFANSSLIQSKMTIQNFELGLKDLNLPDLFHMSFQVQTKPVPILSINNDSETSDTGETDNSENSSNTLLEKYYKAYNLDYQRKNDINIFLQTEKELKTMLNSTNLAISDFVEKREGLKNKLEKDKEEIVLIDKNIQSQFSYETLSDFEQQFLELNNFTTSIAQYTEDLGNLIIAMTKIPIDG